MQGRLPGFDRRAGKPGRFLPVWAVLFACLLVPANIAQARDGVPGPERVSETDGIGSGSVSADAFPSASRQAGSGQAAAVMDTAEPAIRESQAQSAEKGEPAKRSIRLFGTVEFRGKLKNMPKWQRVVAAEQRSRTFDGDLSKLMLGSVHKQWLQLVERVSDKSEMEKAKAVTAFFNRWPYKTDQAITRWRTIGRRPRNS